MPEGEGENSIVIRTMRDDLRDPLNQSSGTAPVPVARKASSKTFPLPPQPKPGAKVVAPPAIRPRKVRGRWKRTIGLLGVLILLIVAGGGAAWIFWAGDFFSSYQESLPIQAMIPQDTRLVVYYTFNDSTARTAAGEAWAGGGNAISVTSLLNGDPRLLLNQGYDGELAYVVLPTDPRPYLLVTRNEITETIFTGSFDARAEISNGWYIVHPLNTGPYTQALEEGGIDTSLAFHEANSWHITLIASSELLRGLREDWLGDRFAGRSAGEATVLRGKFESGSTFLTWESPSVATDTISPLSESQEAADRELLRTVPGDVNFARLGANFLKDVTLWRTANNLSLPALEQPVVAALLNDLDTPYAFYERLGSDGANQFGLVVRLPDDLSGELTLSEPALEQGFRSFAKILVNDDVNIQPAWTETAYGGVLLRYINWAGPIKSTDYAIIDKWLISATSMEGMRTLIDTMAGRKEAVAVSDRWRHLLPQWADIPPAQDMVIGKFTHPLLTQLLPITDDPETLFGMTSQISQNDLLLSGFLFRGD